MFIELENDLIEFLGVLDRLFVVRNREFAVLELDFDETVEFLDEA